MANSTTVLTLPRSVDKSTSFTRPANTTAYAAKDQVGDAATPATILSVSGCGARNGGGGWIDSVVVTSSVVGTSNAAFALLIMDATYTSANDNDAAAITDAQIQNVVGSVQIAATDWAEAGLNKVATLRNLRIPFVCASGSTTLYLALIATAGYTPASEEVISIRLGIRQD